MRGICKECGKFKEVREVDGDTLCNDCITDLILHIVRTILKRLDYIDGDTIRMGDN